MKQIKTIRKWLDEAEDFDTEVNRALRDGWELKNCKVLKPVEQPARHTVLYAELEKELDQ